MIVVLTIWWYKHLIQYVVFDLSAVQLSLLKSLASRT